MSVERILFVVEGSKSEPALIRKLNRIYGIPEKDYLIYSYKNTIHELIDDYIQQSSVDEYLDFKLFLREHTKDAHMKKELNQNFALIYIIFDFEPHYPKFHYDALKKLKNYFNNSLENGLLLLSYPMIEALRHLKANNDLDFFDRAIKSGEVALYKKRVGNESDFHDVTVYNIHDVDYLIAMHLKKLNHLVFGATIKPNRSDLDKIIISEELLRLQYHNYQNKNLPIVSTVFYYLIDYFAPDFYERF